MIKLIVDIMLMKDINVKVELKSLNELKEKRIVKTGKEKMVKEMIKMSIISGVYR